MKAKRVMRSVLIAVLAILVVALIIVGIQLTRYWSEPLTSTSSPSVSDSLSVTETIVASEGGNVEAADGTRIDIPPNTLESDAQITVSMLPLDSSVMVPQDFTLLIREINTSGVPLKGPVKLTFSYNGLQGQDSLAPDAVFVARWQNEEWEYLGGEVDPDHKIITVETDHLSWFAVFTLPTLDRLFSELKTFLSNCKITTLEVDSDWTKLINDIGKASGKQMPIVNVYLENNNKESNNNLLTFRAMVGGKYVLANKSWFEGESDWLPQSKRKFLSGTFLAHELSHHVSDSTSVDLVTSVTEGFRNVMPIDDFINQLLGHLSLIRFAQDQGACVDTVNRVSALRDKLDQLGQKKDVSNNECAKAQKLELMADKDGVTWSSQHFGDINTVGLVFIHYWNRYGSEGGCTHPPGSVRAEKAKKVSEELDLGTIGGVYDEVSDGSGNPLSEVEIVIDGKIEKTDKNGQFLITGVNAGPHTITYSKPGYQSVTLPVDIPVRDLVEMKSVQLLLLPASPSPTTTPLATSTPMPTPTQIPGPTIGADGNVYLGPSMILDVDQEAGSCFGGGKISFSPTSEHFLVVLDCIEGDNHGFLFRADGSNKRQITEEWDYINYHHYEWEADGQSFVYERINSCCDDPPPDAPPAGLVQYNVQTGEKTLLASSTLILYRVINVESDDVLNVRAGPGVDSEIVGSIPPDGTNIQVTGSGITVGNSVWVPIIFEEIVGWVNSDYLAVQSDP